jgi:hypothetical protein
VAHPYLKAQALSHHYGPDLLFSGLGDLVVNRSQLFSRKSLEARALIMGDSAPAAGPCGQACRTGQGRDCMWLLAGGVAGPDRGAGRSVDDEVAVGLDVDAGAGVALGAAAP